MASALKIKIGVLRSDEAGEAGRIMRLAFGAFLGLGGHSASLAR